MSQNMSKFQRNLHGDDRPSSLPDDILIRILCLTESYKCAVKCSVLSRRWKDLYKYLPCLYFSVRDFLNGQGIINEETVAIQDCAAAVTRHQAEVHTLFVEYIRYLSKWEWCIEHFTTSHLQHLTSHSTNYPNALCTPLCIFSCASLVTLSTDSFDTISLRDNFQGFPNLRQFSLRLAVYESLAQCLDDLLRKCPVLEHLTIKLNFNPCEEEYDDDMPLCFSFSSSSLLHLDIVLVYCKFPLQIRVLAPQLLTFSYSAQHQGAFAIKIVMVEVPKLSEVSVPENQNVTLDFGKSGLPKLYERFCYARFRGFPNLCKCYLKLFNIPLCSDASKWLDDFLSSCTTLQHLQLLLSFRDTNDDNDFVETYSDMPLTFLSHSLLDLNVEVEGLPMKLEIKVAGYQLQKLVLNCNTGMPEYRVEVKVEAPNLLEISISSSEYVTLDLHGSLLREKIDGIANAKWSASRHHLTHLIFNDNFERCCENIPLTLSTLSRIWTLKFLELKRINAFPADIWNILLTNLPLLENLMFMKCLFKKEQSITDLNIKKCRMTNLKEVKFICIAHYSFEGAKEFVPIFVENAPNLQMLSFASKTKQQEYKDECIALLGKYLLPGNSLTCDDSSGKVEYRLLKGSVKKLSDR